MDVSQKIDAQTKARLTNLNIECQVLNNLLKEKNAVMQELVKQVLSSLTVNPTQYALKINPSQDIWDLQLRPEALLVPGNLNLPNREARRALKN